MRNSDSMLESQLRNYASQGPYPMHMPGHKRSFFGGLPYGWDVTEVPGTDDLHDAQGILREAMDRTAAVYGATQTWYLVNGSTLGLLAGIRAIAPYGAEIVVARNCHKAVYHALELQNLTAHWVWPHRNMTFEIYESVDPQDIADALDAHPASKAVVITSPTYEGVISDVQRIAEICHAHGVPLLVDEAHGAHLGFHEAFPDTAIHLGADIVVQSPHKTLPALTQTAWMHLGQNALVSPEAIEAELDIFETSSPSYLLMASLDTCTGVLQSRRNEMFGALAENLQLFHPLRNLRLYGYPQDGEEQEDGLAQGVFARDPSKILISGKRCGVTGEALADMLRDEFRFETEMHLGWNVLAMTTICDTKVAIKRFVEALDTIDKQIGDKRMFRGNGASYDLATTAAYPIGEALRLPTETIPAHAAAGRVAAEYVYAYPPGVPLIVPGERITGDILRQLEVWEALGATVQHSARHDGYTVVAG